MSNEVEYHSICYGEDNRWEIMSRLYLEKLTELVTALELGDELGAELSVKYFFNGAAVYANEKICASWSPVGLAFKLPADEVAELVAQGQAKPLKYFAKSPIKQGYALFDNPDSKQRALLKTYFLKSAAQALSTQVDKTAGRNDSGYHGRTR